MASLRKLTSEMTAPLRRVPARLTTQKMQSNMGATSAVAAGFSGATWTTYATEPTASAAATPGYMTIVLIQPYRNATVSPYPARRYTYSPPDFGKRMASAE